MNSTLLPLRTEKGVRPPVYSLKGLELHAVGWRRSLTACIILPRTS